MWYKTGTINLIANNATVTGTGTAWADAKFGVMPGMILLAPDNKLYEVKQVNSNTSLTLNSNYAGSTANGQSYAIITTYEGDISQFSARFAAMLTFFQGSRNDTVSWFTGSGDMTFTKDDGTKLTVPTLAKIQSDCVSRSSTLDQGIASTVLFTKPLRLTSTTTPEFTPTTQGAWIAWNRATTAAGGLAAATDFINNKGSGVGGFNWWNSNSTDTTLCAYLSPAGNFVAKGQLSSTGDMLMNASSSSSNMLIRFRDTGGVEKSAVYAQTDTGAMNIRWNGTAYTMACRTDGLVSVPKGHVITTAMSTPQEVIDIVASNSAPITFRGADYAGFDKPNNYTIGTWNGFSVVPTIGNGLGTGVEQGKPVFSVNARTGITYALNGLYVGSSPVITAGQYGIGGTAVLLPLDTVLDDLKTKPTGKYAVNANGIGMPRAGVAYSLDWALTSNANGGQGTLLASAIITAPSSYDETYRNTLRNGVWQGWIKLWDGNTLSNPMQVGDAGVGAYTPVTVAAPDGVGANQFFRFGTNTTNAPTAGPWAGIMGGYDGASRFQMAWAMGGAAVDLRTRVRSSTGGHSAWQTIWHTGNTTVDANGFLKKASPIARLSNNPEKMPDEYLDGFTLSGLAAVNGEAAGVTAERLSVGVYKVTGSLGFALEGWNIEVPQDVNGNRLCFVATEAAEDGTITVRVSKRRFDIDTAAIVAGEPMDIPEGRWIDLRLEMPPVEEVQNEPEPESHEGEMASE
ncbi:phage tail fiber protein [Serratia fonticola]